MTTRIKSALSLFGISAVSGICAIQMAREARAAAAFPIPKADCVTQACNLFGWVDAPHDGNGDPLPAGVSCTMSNNVVSICATDPHKDCTAKSMLPNGCNGFFQIGMDFYSCYQTIYKC